VKMPFSDVWIFVGFSQVQSTTAPSLGERRDEGFTCLVEGKGRVMHLNGLN